MTHNHLASVCDRCGRELRLGATKYQVYVEITSLWDGYLPDNLGADDAVELIEKAAELDVETLEKQVHMEISLTICPQCRKDILDHLGGEDGTLPGVKRKARARLQ